MGSCPLRGWGTIVVTDTRWTLVTVVTIALIVLSSFHPYPYDNVVTRWVLARQIVEQRTVRIDPYVRLTSDRAVSDGHSYCDKAVVTSALAVVVYRPFHFLAHAGRWASRDWFPAAARYVAERCVVGGSFVLILGALWMQLREDEVAARVAVLALGLASILLPYATLLYGHVPAAAFLFLSYCFQKQGRFGLADSFGALAAATEFPVALLFSILVLYRGRSYWSALRVLRIAGLVLIAFSPQLLHNWLAFGSPTTLGYTLETAKAFAGMQRGFFGFTWPRPWALYLLLLSPERGMLFYMPWTALGFAGFVMGRRLGDVLRSDPRPLLVVTYLLLFSAYFMPSGGWAFGPRHLIPIMPLLALGLGEFASGSRRRWFLVWMLLLPSILQMLIGVFGEIHQPLHPPESPVPLPQVTIGLAMLLDGHHSLWLPGAVGVAALSAAAVALWALNARRCRFHWTGALALCLWVAAAGLGAGQGEVSTSFYRGVLAAHRKEFALAAKYFSEAARDPSAPGSPRGWAEYYRRLAEEGGREG
jgi:hypothetical protein